MMTRSTLYVALLTTGLLLCAAPIRTVRGAQQFSEAEIFFELTLQEESDVDLLYQFKNGVSLDVYADNFFDFQFKLEDLFKREVDLVSLKNLRSKYQN